MYVLYFVATMKIMIKIGKYNWNDNVNDNNDDVYHHDYHFFSRVVTETQLLLSLSALLL